MQRYFAQATEDYILLAKEDEHHLLNVLRSKVGEKIEAVSCGLLYLGEIESINPLKIKIVEKVDDQSELTTNVTLYYCLSKGDKNDFVIQKATELGAKRIVLVSSKRCIVKYDPKDVDKKLERYSKIAKEAAEQCHRLIVPSVEGPIDIKNIKSVMKEEHCYVAFEENKNDNAFAVSKDMVSIGMLIGPEGGLENSEVDFLNSIGFKSISLGKRILRTETAAVYALSVISNCLER